MYNLYLNFQKEQFARHLNSIENDSKNLKQLAQMIYDEGQTFKNNLKLAQEKANQIQQLPQGQINLSKQYESQINNLQQQNQAKNAVLYQNYMQQDKFFSNQIEKNQEFYEKQKNSYMEIIYSLKGQITDQKKLFHNNNKSYNQIISVLTQQLPNAIEEKLKEMQQQLMQKFRNSKQYKQLQKAQEDLKELMKMEEFTDYKQIKEFVSTIKKFLKEQLNLQNSIKEFQQNNQNQITQEELVFYKEILQIFGNDSKILQQMITALEIILNDLDQFNIKQINFENEIKKKEDIIKQITQEQEKQEKIYKQQLKDYKIENEKLFQEKEISKKQLEQSFLKQQEKKINDFSTEIQSFFIIFTFEIIHNTIDQKKKDLNSTDEILKQLNEILKLKEPKTYEELKYLIERCKVIQILNPSSISLNNLKNLVEKVIDSLKKVIKYQNSS